MALVVGLLPAALALTLSILPGQVCAAARGSWTDLGVGCCFPVSSSGMLTFDGGWLFSGALPRGECLEVCQAQCLRFGELCGYVSHGWVHLGNKAKSWCAVVSSTAQVQRRAGHTSCPLFGDSDDNEHCYSYQPAPAEHFFAALWTDLGAGCVEPHDPGAHFLIKGQVRGGLESCMVKCASLGSRCGYINHGWSDDSDYCSIVSAMEETVKFTGPPSCGACGDCSVHAYAYRAPTPAGPWVDLGPGCCVPADPCNVLQHGTMVDSLEACQQQCAFFGSACGWVNYGLRPTWCTVISSAATDVIVRPGEHRDCGSCSDCGVHCWQLGPPGSPVV